jgi:1-acyl-sn-glycerol-3-phosphate acyltransferase
MNKMLYTAGRSIMDLYAHLLLDMDVQWHAPLPEGPKILAANHPTTTDPFLITTLTREPVSVLVTAGAFEVPVFGRYLRRAGHVPAIRNSNGATVDALVQKLEAGGTVAIFPEGSISPLEGGFNQPHSGIARVAIRSGAPVIPVGIGLQRERIRCYDTTLDGKPEVLTWYLNGQYALTVGEPLSFGGEVEDREHVRSVAGQIMQRIVHLAHASSRRVERAPALVPQMDTGPAELSNVG